MQKNILFLFADQHRGDLLPGLSGDFPLRMPHLRRLMDRGTTFTRAATNSPLCVPARACLALGRDYENCGTWNNDFCCSLDAPNFYRSLRSAGYAVAGVGKFDLHKPIMYWGRDGWIPQLGQLGFTRAVENEGKGDGVWAWRHGIPGTYGKDMDRRGLMEAYARDHVRRSADPLDSQADDIPEDAYADNWVTQNALSQLKELLRGEHPWFLMVNFSGPHDPWDVTPAMKASWESVSMPVPEDFPGDKGRLEAVRQNYAAMLENIDRCIGVLLEELEASGQREDTVVIYSADHGEMLGDRGRFHKSLPYSPSVHIPLVIEGADILKGRCREELVQLNDLAATFCALGGTVLPGDHDSRDLMPLATREEALPVRDYQYSALYTHLHEKDDPIVGYEDLELYRKRHIPSGDRARASWRSITTERYRYILHPVTGDEELYDLREDPQERRDMASGSPAVLEAMRSLMEAHLGGKEPVCTRM